MCITTFKKCLFVCLQWSDLFESHVIARIVRECRNATLYVETAERVMFWLEIPDVIGVVEVLEGECPMFDLQFHCRRPLELLKVCIEFTFSYLYCDLCRMTGPILMFFCPPPAFVVSHDDILEKSLGYSFLNHFEKIVILVVCTTQLGRMMVMSYTSLF